MEVNCEECAACCIDWRPIAPAGLSSAHERSGAFQPLDDVYNLLALRREEVRRFVDEGLGDALVPRLFRAEDDSRAVEIDGHGLAAIEGRPAFYVGLRKVPKPVGPFGHQRSWLPACVFLDPRTLRCRIHETDQYPEECRTYPGRNLLMDTETECERVEQAFGGERLIDDDAPDDPPMLGQGAVGGKVFVHPDPSRLSGVVARIASGEATVDDRATFVGAAAGAVPGTTTVDEDSAADYEERTLSADSWVGRSCAAWERVAGGPGEPVDGADWHSEEVDRGAPPTKAW